MVLIIDDDWVIDVNNLLDYYYFNLYFNQDGYYDCEGYY